MAYNPAEYEARRRGYTQQYGASGAMNAYANFLARQRGTRGRQDMLRQYEEAQPRVVAGYSRRGLVGPNVKSGIFSRGLQTLAKQRARNLGDYDQEQLGEQRMYDLGEAQRLEAFKNQLADMESEKAQTIANAARQLYANRMGMI
jgi:hypothetical protein